LVPVGRSTRHQRNLDVRSASIEDTEKLGRTSELTRREGSCNGVFVTNSTAGSIDKPGPFLEVLEKFGVYQTSGAIVKRAIDSDNVTLAGSKAMDIIDRQSQSCNNYLRNEILWRNVSMTYHLMKSSNLEIFNPTSIDTFSSGCKYVSKFATRSRTLQIEPSGRGL
jgi:hypothetical protein